MNNYYRTIIVNLHRIVFYVTKIRIWLRNPSRHSEEDRYEVARSMVTDMNKSMGYKTIGYGMEKLPKEGGYMIYPNHQGKYDVEGIIATHEKPVTFVMDEKKSHIILVREFLDLLGGKRLMMDDPRQTVKTFMEIAGELTQGRRYILFPEGGYKENNRNIVETFKPGSFKLAKMGKVPIVPVALVDSYKVYNSPHKGPVTTYTYYLDPIPYEEFKDMSTSEIAAIVEKRIKEKIEEHLKDNE
jgi:1-acyl-sn-glycerol-3-phosphate acyltransferase